MEIKIREICGEWALDIEMPDRVQVIYFKSRQNALQVMHYLQLVDNIIKLDKKKLQTPMTNYERIKTKIANMSIDEMSKLLSKSDNCEKYCAYTKDGKCNRFNHDGNSSCVDGIKKWLKQEVSE